MNEQTIQKKIIDYLQSIGGFVVKIIIANKVGNPDILCCLNGRFYAFEVKRDTKDKARKLQDYKLALVRKAGGIAGVVWSVDEVKKIIAQADYN